MMYEHLSEGAVKELHKSLEERVNFVRGRRWTVKHAYLLSLEKWVREMVASEPINRADGLIVHSEPFNGKTSSLRYIRDLFGRTYSEDSVYPRQPVIYFLAEKTMKPIDLRTAILYDILPPDMVRITDAAVRKQLKVVLPQIGVRVLMIDELQTIMIGGVSGREAYLDLIMSFGNDFDIHVLGAGLSSLKDLLVNEQQLGTRFDTDEFPLWHVVGNSEKNLSTYKELIEGIVSNMPFPEPSSLTDDDGINAILEMNQEGLLGGIFRTVKDGAMLALREDANALTKDHVVKAQAKRLGGLFPPIDDDPEEN